MREIKFRAWDKIRHEMYKVDAIDWNCKVLDKEPCILDSMNDAWRLKDLILMQYTNLKDKNGKEVFEGDIYKSPVTGNKSLHGEWSIHKVIMRNGHAISSYQISEKGQIVPKNYMSGFLTDIVEFDIKTLLMCENYQIENLEIIGNIYENPELLEANK